MFKRPRVLVREITGKFPQSVFSAYTDDVLLNNKSIINVLHKTDDTEELQLLEAVLNSKVVSFFYKSRGVKSSRKLFPKIVIKNLREFPYPKHIDPAIRGQIIELSGALRGLFQELNQSSHARSASLLSRIEFNEDKLNQLIYAAFGLQIAEIELIEKGQS